jgi:hypothetical protein
MDYPWDFTGPPDPRCAFDAVVEPVMALQVASRAAARALRHGGSDVARDVAAGALALLLEKKMPLSPASICATVKHLARRGSRLAALARPAPAPPTLEGEEDLAEIRVDAPEVSGSAREPAPPFSRTFACGSIVRLDGAICEADLPDLTLERPDGSVLRGRDALSAAHRLLLAERSSAAGEQQAGNTHRAIEALSRDALLLSVAGLSWQEALARLAGLGVHVSRDGLRSGQRAARRRVRGLAAHDRCVSALPPRRGDRVARG